MKLKLLLSILLFIATTLSALHEIEHIEENDEVCMVYHINDNLTSVDSTDIEKDVDLFRLKEIRHNNLVLKIHQKDKSNPDRAPPSFS